MDYENTYDIDCISNDNIQENIKSSTSTDRRKAIDKSKKEPSLVTNFLLFNTISRKVYKKMIQRFDPVFDPAFEPSSNKCIRKNIDIAYQIGYTKLKNLLENTGNNIFITSDL
ncbi:hypothetical protein F8M41_002764 [Gigaspora margarita]|uniref:Uncharacterized protein n=1 Tax=Gigaspora margarita TaxID=4874 RepID=A0A8H3XFD7_GIGMA|nr:hypothetical protein F8M41_002764 [Gigaspora margarita]